MPSWKAAIDARFLDTQVFFAAYLVEFNKLSKKTQALIWRPGTARFISAASVMEIAIKSAVGKLKMSGKDTLEALRDLQITVLPFDARHAYRLFELPLHHRDPYDRIIVATALAEKLPLVSGDRAFTQYKDLKILW